MTKFLILGRAKYNMSHAAHSIPNEPTRIAVAVVEHEGRFLIGPRPAGIPLAGLWEFPGGKVEFGETAAQAAARECQEETGLSIEVGASYPAVVHPYDHGRLALEFFACRPLDPQQPPLPPFRWVALDELAKYPFPAANAGLIEFLVRAAGPPATGP